MSEDFLKNPLSLFDIRGKTAIVTGATGAFGALAAKVLAGAGANVVLCAEQCGRAEEGRRRMREARRQGRDRRQAPELGGQLRCDRAGGGQDVRPRRYPRGRVRTEQGLQDRRPEAGRFPRRDGRQRHPVLADGARRRPADAQAGSRRQGHPDVVGARAARSSRRLHRLLRLEVGGRRHHQGARLRVGRYRHHGQCARADRVSLAADPMDVRGHRHGRETCARVSSRACPRAASASRPILPGRCCSSRPRRRTSIPATSSTPTAATRRGEPWRSAHRRHRRGPDGPRHRPGVRARRARRVDLRFGRGEPRQRQGAHSRPICGISATTSRRSSACVPTADLAAAVRDADYVVEAVLEDLPLKQKLFAEIERHVRPRDDPRQQYVGDPDHQDHGEACATARARSAPIGGTRPIWCRWSR